MRLAINIDHVATLRQARGGPEPDPVTAAHMCELAGAEGIVCHLREDRRHVNDRDLRLLRETIKTKLDLEMAAVDEIVRIALETGPDLVTFVPERREERTTEGGLNVAAQKKRLAEVIAVFRSKSIPVSLFVEPERAQLEASRDVGAEMVELHTGGYANARTERQRQELLVKIQSAAQYGKTLGLGVNAGHGLNYVNTYPIAAIREIDELSIGHAIMTRALFVGMTQAVQEMLQIVKQT
jgi:pyridoxine 5-phosphate synthase